MDLEELQRLGAREQAAAKPRRVRVCAGAACESTGGAELRKALTVAAAAAHADVEVLPVGCLGKCGAGPLVRVDPGEVFYERATSAGADAVLRGEPHGPFGDSTVRAATPDPFFAGQLRIVLENCGRVDPERIESSLVAGAYQTLATVLHDRTPGQVVDTVTRSGLRGRGRAGYPTGVKWATVAKQSRTPKYVICNGDEGDPGAFMDRSVMEGDPTASLRAWPLPASRSGPASAMCMCGPSTPSR